MVKTDVLRDCLISPNEADSNLEPANVVDGLYAIARALRAVAKAIEELGTNDAMYPSGAKPGAIELLAEEIRNGFTSLSTAINERSDDLGYIEK